MRDIDQLKKRVLTAERQLSATETARNRESQALMEMWRQIQSRFADQEQEIARYRARVDALVTRNEELARMVDDMLATIEGSIDRTRDETVPHITGHAKELLAAEPSEEMMRDAAAALEDEPLPLLPDTEQDDVLVLDSPEPEDAPYDDAPQIDPNGALSPGIRNLISRIEQIGPAGQHDGDDPSDELSRELREIESLRSELSGLRERLSAGGNL